MLKSVFLLTLIIIFTGCITKRNVVPSMQGSNIIKVESKNFIKGEMKKSFIGQIMLEEKKYFIKKEFLSTMSPVVAFDIRGPLGIHLYGNPSFKYEILGTTIIKNHKFNILAYENKKNKYHGRKMLIDDNNILYNKILNGKDNIEVMWDLNIYPRIVKFNNNLENNQIVLTNKPYINYKLFFSGIENNKIKHVDVWRGF